MSVLTLLYAGLFYVATVLLLGGLTFRIYCYASTPAPLKIPTTPAPINRRGVVFRLTREVVLFESLFKGSKWTWLLAWIFHFALLLVLLRHGRYFWESIPALLQLVQPLGFYAGIAMLVGLIGLWMRRFLVDRVQYISAPSDHLMLALLVLTGLSGLGIRHFSHTDIVAVKDFFQGLISFNWHELPPDPLLLVHLALVATLMIVFPFSKLLHAPGILFSPTRNQVDNPREKRHIAEWAQRLDEGAVK